MNQILSSRHSKTCETLFDALVRVAQTVAKNDVSLNKYCELLTQGHFLPAGRTLLTADPRSKTIIPNCAVVPPDPQLYRSLMPLTIGLGSNLNYVTDVVSTMKILGKIPKPDATGRKPGIMQTLKWDHPEVLDFIHCKHGVSPCDPLFNMNISLLVPRDEYQKFRHSHIFPYVVESAMVTGDPGILFPITRAQHTLATSPCGELWMNPFEVCTLGNINVSHFVDGKGRVKTKELIESTNTSITFLNDVIDRLALPLEQMRIVSKKHRRIGLGIMGFADALRNANVTYGSPQSFMIAHKLAIVMKQTARAKKSEFNNASVLALAPTGGTAMLVDASYSLEPYFKEALSVSVKNQIKMVETWQKQVDNAISKTINLSKYSTFEEAAHVFDLAYKHGLKGITIYKDGSRDFQPIACSVC